MGIRQQGRAGLRRGIGLLAVVAVVLTGVALMPPALAEENPCVRSIDEPVQVLTRDSDHFRVYYTTEGTHATSADYVDRVLAAAEEAHAVKHGVLGWDHPDPSPGADGLFRICVWYHPVWEEGGSVRAGGMAFETHITVHSDLGSERQLAWVTAHEYAHVLQYVYRPQGTDPGWGDWIYEGLAEWSAGMSNPANLETWVRPMPASILDSSYSAVAFHHWLTGRYGDDLPRDLFAGGGFFPATATLDDLLREKGTTLSDELIAFYARAAVWEPAGLPYEVVLLNTDTLPASGQASFSLDALSYQAYTVPIPTDGDRTRVVVEGPEDVVGGVAVVASHDGDELRMDVDMTLEDGRGEVVVDGTGSELTVTEVTVVVVNADATYDPQYRPDPFDGARVSYVHDDVPYTLTVTNEPGDPVTGFLEGTVTDARTGEPLAGADVTIEGDGVSEIVVTPDDGSYRLELFPGHYEVTASAPAYDEAVTLAEVTSGETTTADLSLEPDHLACALRERMAGDNRFDTAATLSQACFEPSVDVVYAATGWDYPDALAGGVAAGMDQAPTLLVNHDGIPAETDAELRRLAPERVVVLGGPAAVSDATLAALGDYTNGPVSRLAGPDRYATAVEVSRATLEPAPGEETVAFVGTGTNFPDALAAVPPATAKEGPILLTRPDRLPDVTRDELRRLQPDTVYVLGGEGVVSAEVFADLEGLAGEVHRAAGDDRFETSTQVGMVLLRLFGADRPDPLTVFIATGESFPDALAAGAIAGLTPAPIYLVGRDTAPAEVLSRLEWLKPERLVVLGGAGAVSPEVEAELRAHARG